MGDKPVRAPQRRGRKPPPSLEIRRRQFLRRFPWPALLLGPLACVLLGAAVLLSWQWISLSASGVATDAVVVSSSVGSRGPGTIVVELRDRSGVVRQQSVVAAANEAVGETVRVIYSESDPDVARIDDSLNAAMVLGFLWAMAIGLIVATWQVVVRARRRA
jgi:hypothetical protein